MLNQWSGNVNIINVKTDFMRTVITSDKTTSFRSQNIVYHMWKIKGINEYLEPATNSLLDSYRSSQNWQTHCGKIL